MTEKPDLDGILRDLREATKRAEEALRKQQEAEPEKSNADIFGEHIDGLFGRTSAELTEEFVRDYPSKANTTTTDNTEETS